MDDEIIRMDEIYLQDVVCGIVAGNVQLDDFLIYNKVVTMVDVPVFEVACKILRLIRLNKLALSD